MKIERKFEPVHIILETRHELNIFWDLIEALACADMQRDPFELNSEEKGLLSKISNGFSDGLV